MSHICFFCFGASLGHKAGEAICTGQPPLSLLQYSDSRSLCLLVVGRFCWVGLQKTLKATERRGPTTCSVVVLYVLDPILFFGSWWLSLNHVFGFFHWWNPLTRYNLHVITEARLIQKYNRLSNLFCYQLNSMFDGLRFLWFAWIIPKLFAIEKTKFIS